MSGSPIPGKAVALARSIWESLGRPDVAGVIDATILDPLRPPSSSLHLIEDAARLGVYCALLPPSHLSDPVVRVTAERLGVRLCSVAGFPYGYQPLEVKLAEMEALASAGAVEVDYVIDVSRARAGDLDYIGSEIEAAARRAESTGVKLKLILEVPVLDDHTLSFAVDKAVEHGVFMLKTSTGVITKGGDPVTVARLAEAAKGRLPVKAAGGIRTVIDALMALGAGAARIGASAYRDIVAGFEALRGAVVEDSPSDR